MGSVRTGLGTEAHEAMTVGLMGNDVRYKKAFHHSQPCITAPGKADRIVPFPGPFFSIVTYILHEGGLVVLCIIIRYQENSVFSSNSSS